MDKDRAPLRRVLLAAALALAALATLPSIAAAAGLEAIPPSVNFGPGIVGQKGGPVDIPIYNPSPGSEGIESVSVDSTDFVTLSDSCDNAVVEEMQACHIVLAFEPQAGGPRSGLLAMELSGGSTLEVPLSGTGVVSRITVPASESFAATTVGSTITQQIPLKNQGDTDLTISDIKIEGADANDFKLESNCQGPMMKGAGCMLSVGFLPSATGQRTAQLKVVSDGFPGEQFVALSGEGLAPSLSFEPSSIDFGLVEVHSGNQQMLTLRNTGPSTVQIGNVGITGPDTNEFFVPNNSCSGTLSSLQTCSIQVQFNANNEGSFNAAVRVEVGSFSFEAPLKGRAERPEIEPSEAPVVFEPTGVGAGQVRELTLTNTGNLPVGFFIAIVSGGDVSSFQLVEEHCTGRLIMPGDTCRAEIRFRPQSAGAKQATVSFFGNGDGALQLPVEGVGTAPQLTLSPSSHDFGAVAAGGLGPRQVFELRNDSADPYEVDSVGLAGADLGEFSIRADDCTETLLAPGATCAVAVRFEPESAGAKAAKLRLRGEAGAIVAELRGEGTPAVAAASPTPASASAAPAALVPAASNRLVLQLSPKAKLAGGKRLLIGRARCESSQPCVVSLGGRTSAAGRALVRSRVTVGAGKSIPLALVVPAQLRDPAGAKKLVVTVSWRAGEARGGTTRTFAVPR